jgi:endonuclease/exonuclease/phosphatase family metal-dependent hydrolase
MVRLLRKINLWLIFFTLIAYTAPFISPHTVSFVLFVGLAYPWLLLLNVIFIILWALSRMKYWLYSAVCVLMGWNYMTSVVGFHFRDKALAGQTFKIMTYNVGGIVVKGDKLFKFNDFLAAQNCDVICAQEFSGTRVIDFKLQTERLSVLSQMPYNVPCQRNTIAIFSKYPIVKKGSLSFENDNGSNGCSFADIQMIDKIIRVYAVHLRSNTVTDIADDLADDDYEKRATWSKIFTMLKRVRKMAQHRAKESERIAAHMASSPYPVIICGDFNDIPVSYSYSTLGDKLKDTFSERGFGFGVTYNGNIPALKIDHILTDKKMAVFSCKILKVPYSDHYPVVSEIGLP